MSAATITSEDCGFKLECNGRFSRGHVLKHSFSLMADLVPVKRKANICTVTEACSTAHLSYSCKRRLVLGENLTCLHYFMWTDEAARLIWSFETIRQHAIILQAYFRKKITLHIIILLAKIWPCVTLGSWWGIIVLASAGEFGRLEWNSLSIIIILSQRNGVIL